MVDRRTRAHESSLPDAGLLTMTDTETAVLPPSSGNVRFWVESTTMIVGTGGGSSQGWPVICELHAGGVPLSALNTAGA
jgi:hypothetical protein